MRLRIITGMIISLSFFAGSCLAGGQDDTFRQDLAAMQKEYRQTADTTEKVRLLESFLTAHPETAYTVQLVSIARQLIGHELGNPAAAVELIQKQLRLIEDEQIEFGLKMELLAASHEAGLSAELRGLAEELLEKAPEDYEIYFVLAEAAASDKQWQKAMQEYSKALELVTEENFIKKNPGYANYASGRDNRMRALRLRGFLGIAEVLQSMGRTSEALEACEEAVDNAEIDLFGTPEGELNRIWAELLLAENKQSAAAEKLAGLVISYRDAEARKMLKSVLSGMENAPALEDYLENYRGSNSRVVEEFTLSDYSGTARQFSEMKGRSATLLVFWHPT